MIVVFPGHTHLLFFLHKREREREYDRKVRSIVDIKPEKRVFLADAFSTLSIPNRTAFPEGTRAHEVPDNIALGYHKSVFTWPDQKA